MNGETKDPWMLTRSGVAFDFASPELVRLDDIAWSLSMQCRWTGHTRRFYSVAQHCIHVSRRAFGLAQRDPDADTYWCQCVARLGLLHDAEEAYTGDIATPVKDIWEHSGMRTWGGYIRDAVFTRFGPISTPKRLAVIKQADRELAATEASQLMPAASRAFYCESDVLGFQLPSMTQREAYDAFLYEAEMLGIR